MLFLSVLTICECLLSPSIGCWDCSSYQGQGLPWVLCQDWWGCSWGLWGSYPRILVGQAQGWSWQEQDLPCSLRWHFLAGRSLRQDWTKDVVEKCLFPAPQRTILYFFTFPPSFLTLLTIFLVHLFSSFVLLFFLIFLDPFFSYYPLRKRIVKKKPQIKTRQLFKHTHHALHVTIWPFCSAQDGGEKKQTRGCLPTASANWSGWLSPFLAFLISCLSLASSYFFFFLLSPPILLLLSLTHTPLTYTPWLQSIRTPLLLCSTSPTTLACSSQCTYSSLDRQTQRTTQVDRGGGGVVVRVIVPCQGCLCKSKLGICIRIAECLCSLPGKRRMEQRTEGREMSPSCAFFEKNDISPTLNKLRRTWRRTGQRQPKTNPTAIRRLGSTLLT